MALENVLVNLNGQIVPATEAKVSAFDRSYLYGDSLYEVMRSFEGVFLDLEGHLKRLEESAKLCQIKLGQPTKEYVNEIYKTFHAFRNLPGMRDQEAYCRLVISRGVGKIGFGHDSLLTPTQYTIIVQPLALPTPAQFQKGFHLKIARRLRNDRRALDPAMKSGNYLNSLLAYLEATDDGYNDALMLNFDGHVTEGTTFNIFYVRNGIVATPPLDIGILDGITRRTTLEEAKRLGHETREVRFPRERLYEADEVFLTSTVRGVFPVTRVDTHVIHGGKPGPITEKLARALEQAILKTIRHYKSTDKSTDKSKASA